MVTQSDGGPDSGVRESNRSPSATLTVREVEVLELTAVGLSNREIGQQLFLSEHTILGYMKSIFVKLGVHSRVQAVVVAIGMRIITVPDLHVDLDG